MASHASFLTSCGGHGHRHPQGGFAAHHQAGETARKAAPSASPTRPQLHIRMQMCTNRSPDRNPAENTTRKQKKRRKECREKERRKRKNCMWHFTDSRFSAPSLSIASKPYCLVGAVVCCIAPKRLRFACCMDSCIAPRLSNMHGGCDSRGSNCAGQLDYRPEISRQASG